jgi:hypothetical protein
MANQSQPQHPAQPHWSHAAAPNAHAPMGAPTAPTTATNAIRAVIPYENYWPVRTLIELGAAGAFAATVEAPGAALLGLAALAVLALTRRSFVIDARARTLSLSRVSSLFSSTTIPFDQLAIRSVTKTTNIRYMRQGRQVGTGTNIAVTLELAPRVEVSPHDVGYSAELAALLAAATGRAIAPPTLDPAVSAQRVRAVVRAAITGLSLAALSVICMLLLAQGHVRSVTAAMGIAVCSLPLWALFAARVQRVLEAPASVAIGRTRSTSLRFAPYPVAAIAAIALVFTTSAASSEQRDLLERQRLDGVQRYAAQAAAADAIVANRREPPSTVGAPPSLVRPLSADSIRSALEAQGFRVLNLPADRRHPWRLHASGRFTTFSLVPFVERADEQSAQAMASGRWVIVRGPAGASRDALFASARAIPVASRAAIEATLREHRMTVLPRMSYADELLVAAARGRERYELELIDLAPPGGQTQCVMGATEALCANAVASRTQWLPWALQTVLAQ